MVRAKSAENYGYTFKTSPLAHNRLEGAPRQPVGALTTLH